MKTSMVKVCAEFVSATLFFYDKKRFEMERH